MPHVWKWQWNVLCGRVAREEVAEKGLAREGLDVAASGDCWMFLSTATARDSHLPPSRPLPSSSSSYPPIPCVPHRATSPISTPAQRSMIPANDAFQLSLKHEPNRLGLHSSAKLPFLSGARRSQSPVSTRASPSDRPAMPTRRTSAATNGNGNAHAAGNGHSPQQPTTTVSANGHATATAAKHARKGSRSAAKGKAVVVQRSWSQKVIHEWEIPRKVLHSSIGEPRVRCRYVQVVERMRAGFLTLYLYYSNGSPQKVVVALASGLAFIVPCDVLRLRSARFERLFEGTVGFLMRESEKVRFLFARRRVSCERVEPAAETNEWRYMVHHRRHVRPCRLPHRPRGRIHPHVSSYLPPSISHSYSRLAHP